MVYPTGFLFQNFNTDQLTAIEDAMTSALTPTISPTLLAAFNAAVASSGYGIPVLSANATYYVSKTGNDSNNGLSPSTAFLTIQHALNVVSSIIIGPFSVDINVGDGTYSEGLLLNGPWLGTGLVTIIGNTTTPTSCIISAVNKPCITLNNASSLVCFGFGFTNSGTAFNQITVQQSSIFQFNLCDFGSSVAAHLVTFTGATIVNNNRFGSNYSISGGATSHYGGSAGEISVVSLGTITVTGTPTFTRAFCVGTNLNLINAGGNTYSGAATGPRYEASNGGFIQTGGGGANYFPGSTAGTGTNFGVSPFGLYS